MHWNGPPLSLSQEFKMLKLVHFHQKPNLCLWKLLIIRNSHKHTPVERVNNLHSNNKDLKFSGTIKQLLTTNNACATHFKNLNMCETVRQLDHETGHQRVQNRSKSRSLLIIYTYVTALYINSNGFKRLTLRYNSTCMAVKFASSGPTNKPLSYQVHRSRNLQRQTNTI